jgi:uncharacterized protein involved in tolerance to divalent cations
VFTFRQAKNEKELEKKALIKALRQAEHEMDVAMSYFHESTDPEIIDHAIYLMEAAKKKYSYFLKKARQENLFTN